MMRGQQLCSSAALASDHRINPMPSAGVKILFLLGWMDVVVARSRQVVVLAM